MTDRTVLVTGVTGFVGPVLAEEFLSQGWSVIGIGRDADAGSLTPRLADYVQTDLTRGAPDLPDVDAVVHLAGLAAVGPSFGHPQRYIADNSAMLTNLAEALLRRPSRARILVVSSGAVYAAPQGEEPLSEGAPFGFDSPYAVSKVLVENQASYYTRRGLDGVVARPFNHVGPGQRPGFLLPDLIQSVAASRAAGPPLQTGDLSTVRDYTDVRDVARAYRMLIEAPELGHRVYNVCSGVGTSGDQLLDGVLEALGAGQLPRVVDPSRLRPQDPPRIVGDASRVMADLGWKPEVPLTTTIADMLGGLSPSI